MIEVLFICYVNNNYLREVIVLDLILSLFYHLLPYFFFAVQLMNFVCFITLLFFHSLRVYSLFWFYIILKNECRIFIIKDTQKKRDTLLKNNHDMEDSYETSTIISV
jgi:hypothetical protein